MLPHIKIIAIIFFILTYILLIAFYNKKHYIVSAAAILAIIIGLLTPAQAFQAINWNVMGLFVGMLILSSVFIYSQMPDFLATWFANKSRTVGSALIAMCVLSGFISMFIENVATVLIVAPITIQIARKLKTNPIPFVIGVAICSNLEGTATLIGDPPSMLLAGFMKMTFNDFFFYFGKPGIFFAVQLGAVASLAILWFMFKKYNKPVEPTKPVKIISWVPTILLIIFIVFLGFSSLIDKNTSYLAGTFAMIFGVIGLLWYSYHKKSSTELIKKLDWSSVIFLTGIFIVVGIISVHGILNDLASYISTLVDGNVLIAFLIIVWVSVFLSAIIDNVPYIIVMMPVVVGIAVQMGSSSPLLLFGLMIGTSIGGNITPIGASSNIVGCSLLKQEGYEVKFWDFVKIGLPFTIVGVITSTLFIWFVWS